MIWSGVITGTPRQALDGWAPSVRSARELLAQHGLGYPGSCRRILSGAEPALATAAADPLYEDPTLRYLAKTPGLPPDVVRGLVALARTWRDGDGGTSEPVPRRA